ncbi:MAG: hydantoinase B/oxoprolinase family protein [Myxococcota bacterium]
MRPFEVWIDRGGTFTDCLGRGAEGSLRVAKVPSDDDAPIRGIEALLGLPAGAPLPPCDVRIGTTVATNALLERTGAPTALLTHAGFEDLLLIDDQTRPALFDLRARRPPPLAQCARGLGARTGASGETLGELDRDELRRALDALRAEGIEALAVAFLHADRHPELEGTVAEAARRHGFTQVTASHEVSAEIGLLARAQTAVVDAYLTPGLRRYVATLEARLPGSRIRWMTSAGALVSGERFRGRDAVLSGPAGGVVALGAVARRARVPEVLGLDMGGTSTDVSRVAGEAERRHEISVAGVRLRAPAVAVHTIAAGGGSLLRVSAGLLLVGPESAGASPGPLAYGRAEAQEPALTDAALVLGRVHGARFPFALHAERAREGLARLAGEAGLAGANDAERAAEGFLAVATAAMAEAIEQVSVARGHDARRHALVLFGGAAGQYGCAVADRLGVRQVLAHPQAGVLSAWGLGLAPVGWRGARAVGMAVGAEELPRALAAAFAGLAAEGRAALAPERRAGDGTSALREQRAVVVLRPGTATRIALAMEAVLGTDAPAGAALASLAPAALAKELRRAFDELHRARFGYVRENAPLEVAAVELASSVPATSMPEEAGARAPARAERAPARLFHDGAWREVPVRWREDLASGEAQAGPLLVLEPTSTLVVDPGWTLHCEPGGLLRLRREASARPATDTPSPSDETAPDPVALTLAVHRVTAVAERMGVVLQRTASSTNIRDRLDYSCAVFDAEGALIANAPHIPVHLGAMGATVRAVLAQHPRLGAGDAVVANDPAAGGSHLPDVTVVVPVYDAAGRRRFFVAARGHHADVGGITPGSMPAFSASLAEEGVVFPGLLALRGGVLQEAALRAALGAGPHPARRPDENLADLEAQLASCRLGARLLREALDGPEGPSLLASLGPVQDLAAEAVEEALGALPRGERRFADALDDGTPVVVTVERRGPRGERLRVDFTGTGAAVPGNLNAPRAVTVACVLYALRTLVRRPIPLNEGCLRAVDLVIPEGSLLSPPAGAAVAGGNVETSQRVVDVLLGAFGVAAASQGTMNNVSLGDAHFGYYETLAGGAGAGPDFPGADAVHTHMTNSRITDPETLERRHPLRLRRFSLRHGSGGPGAFPGGRGVVRELEARAPLTVSLLSERRERAPFGLAGGGSGATGRQLVLRRDGRVEEVPGKARLRLEVGDVLRIETPGGGGYGAVRGAPRAGA